MYIPTVLHIVKFYSKVWFDLSFKCSFFKRVLKEPTLKEVGLQPSLQNNQITNAERIILGMIPSGSSCLSGIH